jgi:ribokinase
MNRLVALGSLNIDLVIPVDRLPRPGETLAGGDLAIFEGGKGANQACAAARLGGLVTMIGQTGDDPFAARLRDMLRGAGVDVSGIGISQRPTGTALISVLPNGENMIVISPGANAALSREMALERLRAASPYGFLLGQLETPMATVTAAFAEAHGAGATTILDPAPVQPLPAELITHVDFITPNQTEAAVLLGRGSDGPRTFDEAKEAAERLRESGYRGVVLKLGELGCYVAAGGVSMPSPGFAVAAVDTTAAGDTFNAAFAVALAEGAPVLDAAHFANAAAALSVTRPGAQNSIPARSEVEAFLASRSVTLCSR